MIDSMSISMNYFKMNYENGHCGGPEFFSAYVMVEGQKGAVLGWDYPGSM